MVNKKHLSKLIALCTSLVLSVTALTTAVAPVPANAATSVTIDRKNFPDANFRGSIRKLYDKNKDGKLSAAEIKKIAYLYISCYNDMSSSSETCFSGVNDLKGVEKLTSLNTLYIYGAQKTTKLDLSGLKSLKELNISGCSNLKSLNVSGLKRLQTMSVQYCNKLQTLDVTSNTALQEVSCASNQDFETLKTGTNNKKLAGVYVYNTAVSKLDLSKLRALKELNISETSVDLSQVGIKNKNRITDLRVSNAKKNKNLNLRGYTGLTYLEADGLGLKTIDLSANKKLQTLSLYDNKLTKLNLSKQTALENIYVGNNKSLKTLDLSHAKKISYIWATPGVKIVLPKDVYTYTTDATHTFTSVLNTKKAMAKYDSIYPVSKKRGQEISIHCYDY